MEKCKVKLGVVPTRRDFLKNPETDEHKRIIMSKIKELSGELEFDTVGISGVNSEDLLFDIDDVPAISQRFKNQNVDALFVPHCNFGQEEAVAALAVQLKVPVLLWGFRDEKPDGTNWRGTDTQCGLFAISKVLTRCGIKFTYIENCNVDDPQFKTGVADFIAAMRVVHAFKNMRIGQISVRPRQFMSVMSNEGELLEKFGITVVPIDAVSLFEEIKSILANRVPELETILQDIAKAGIGMDSLTKDKQLKMAACELGLREFAEKNNCCALASECWSIFSESFGIRPCFIFGNLTDKGLPVACENDIHGAISSVLAYAVGGYRRPVFFADLTIRHPENDNAELLWHCGPFPKSLKKPEAKGYINDYCQGNWEIDGGNITIVRFDGVNGQYRLFADEAKGVPGPVTCGNYVWIETEDWVRWEKKFIYGPYIHHVSGVYGQYQSILKEACRYLPGVRYDDADVIEDWENA